MRYRYRTPVLFGAWYTSAAMARADAIRAGQAYRDGDGTMQWRAQATLEAAPAGKAAWRGTCDPSRVGEGML
jgi:hypothetical protein